MQLRTLSGRYSVLIALLITSLFALSLNAEELRKEERSPGVEPAHPLAATLGVRFVEGSTSSVILERDGKEYVVDLATRAGAKQLFLFHHDPTHDDERVSRMLAHARQIAGSGTHVEAAREGLEVVLKR